MISHQLTLFRKVLWEELQKDLERKSLALIRE